MLRAAGKILALMLYLDKFLRITHAETKQCSILVYFLENRKTGKNATSNLSSRHSAHSLRACAVHLAMPSCYYYYSAWCYAVKSECSLILDTECEHVTVEYECYLCFATLGRFIFITICESAQNCVFDHSNANRAQNAPQIGVCAHAAQNMFNTTVVS